MTASLSLALSPRAMSSQGAVLEQRLKPAWGARRLKNYLLTLTMEVTTLARACSNQDVHYLEREDLAALAVEVAAMAQVPLAGTDWPPGAGPHTGYRVMADRTPSNIVVAAESSE